MKRWGHMLFGLIVIIVIFAATYWIVSKIWEQFMLLDSEVSATLLTAAATVMAATVAVTIGKYYERKIDIEAHHRAKKIEVYDEFLSGFFDLIASSENKDLDNLDPNDPLVQFFREWQRKMILWGGHGVLVAYTSWMSHMRKGAPDLQGMLLVDEFFREIRRDLGHQSNKLKKGALIGLIVSNPEVFLEKAKENPNMTLEEMSKYETN